MYLPQLQPGNTEILNTTTFRGYNHNSIIQDGEVYDGTNLSGDEYPLLTQRKSRSHLGSEFSYGSGTIHAIHGRDQLVMIRGTKVYYNFTEVSGITVSESTTMLPKRIVDMGAYCCIWPDKKYFNTVTLTDCGDIGRTFSTAGTGLSAMMCRGDGTDYSEGEITVSPTAPSSPAEGKLWLDTSGSNHVLRQWSGTSESWVEVATTYVKISGTGIGSNVRMYDVLDISGLNAPSGASAAVQRQVQQLNGSKIVYFADTNYIVVMGLLSQQVAAFASGTVNADRNVPDLDWIVESNNRLWGCKYGLVNGAPVNEIKACKLGDFRNWNVYMGLSTDSYTASVGTDGPFTGAVTQRGYPVFFKEDYIHRVGGSAPSSFTVTTTVCEGCEEGSGESVRVVGEAIVYKGRSGILQYDGNLPVPISAQLGPTRYKNARAGVVGQKYYLCMQNPGGAWNLFVYDGRTGTWWREDGLQVNQFATVKDTLWASTPAEDYPLHALTWEANPVSSHLVDEFAEPEDWIEWEAVFGIFGTDYRGNKYVSRFDIRMQIEDRNDAQHDDADALRGQVDLYIQYDSNGTWVRQGGMQGRGKRTFVFPVIPRRCDHCQLKLVGRGRCRIYSISRVLEVGADG